MRLGVSKRERKMKKRLISMICLICLFFTGLCGKNPFNTTPNITKAATSSTLAVTVGNEATTTMYSVSNVDLTVISEDTSIVIASITGMSITISGGTMRYGKDITFRGLRPGTTNVKVLMGSTVVATCMVSVEPVLTNYSGHIDGYGYFTVTTPYEESFESNNDRVECKLLSTTRKATKVCSNGEDTVLVSYEHIIMLKFEETGQYDMSIYGSSSGYVVDIISDISDHDFSQKRDEDTYVKKKATCLETGENYYACSVCGQKGAETFETAALGHSYGSPQFLWSEDRKECKVKFTCGNDTSHTITYDCSVSSTVKGEATCISKGTTTYTASYGSGKNKITDTKDVKDIPVNPDNHANEIEIKGNKEATCGEEGYTGDTFCKDCGSRIQKGIVIEKKKHNYKNPVFNWTDDKKRAIVMFICSNNVDHTITYECTVTSVVTAYATCTTKGITTYTASYGEGGNKVTEVKEVQDIDLDQNNHIGGTEVRNYKDATSESEGYTGDIVCKGCNKVLRRGSIIAKASTNSKHENQNVSKTVVKISKVSGVKLKAKKKKIIVKWKMQKGVDGYQISISTNKKFKKSKKHLTTITSKTIKKLKKKQNYYVRIRAGVISGNKMVYGKWSATKKIRVK